MNLQETISLIQALKSAGVTKFKSLEHDIILDAIPIGPKQDAPKNQPVPAGNQPIVDNPVENKEATEKLKDLIGTLKLSDEELANHMFPDGAL
jgi:hypothetical protein